MARCYVVALPDGRTVRVRAAKPPTRADAEAIADLLEAVYRKEVNDMRTHIERPGEPGDPPAEGEKPKE